MAYPKTAKGFQGDIEVLCLDGAVKSSFENGRHSNHSLFLYDLIQANRHWLLDDFQPDPLAILSDMAQSLKENRGMGWIASRRGQPLGLIWVEVDSLRIGRLYGAAMPQVQQGLARDSLRLSQQFIAFCFEQLQLRKLVAEVSTENQNAERLLLTLGFKKEGLLLNESLKQGKPVHWVRLRLFPTQNPTQNPSNSHSKTKHTPKTAKPKEIQHGQTQ